MATQTTRYADLISTFPLRPIRTKRQLDRACRVAKRLSVRPRLSRDEQDYLDVLAVLIEAYEDAQQPIAEVSGVEALSYLIEENGLSLPELSRATGISVATLSAVLDGRRQLTREHIERLCAYFHVGAGLFVRPVMRRAED